MSRAQQSIATEQPLLWRVPQVTPGPSSLQRTDSEKKRSFTANPRNTLQLSIRQPIAAFSVQRDYLKPLLRVIRSFLRINRYRLIRIAVLSVVSSLCTAGGFLLLIPLTRYVTNSLDRLSIGDVEVPITPVSISVLMGLIVGFVFAGIRINYVFHLRTLDVMRATIVEAAARGLEALQYKFADRFALRPVRRITTNLAFSCGNVMRQFSSALSDLVTIPVYLVILLWLNPLVTLLMLLLLLVSGGFIMLTMNKVTKAVKDRKLIATGRKQEQKDFMASLEQAPMADVDLRKRIYQLYETGYMGEAMRNKLGIRREKRRGPLFAEYLFPLSLIIIPGIVFATGDIRSEAPRLVPYLFLLRNFLGLFKGIMSNLVTMGKFHPGIECYHRLVTEEVYPDCLSPGQIDEGDDDDDD